MERPSRQLLSEQLFTGSCELDRIKQVIETTLGMILGLACKIEVNEETPISGTTQVTPTGCNWEISGNLKKAPEYSAIKLTLNSPGRVQLTLYSGMDWHVKRWDVLTAILVYENLDDAVLKLFEIIPGLKERCRVFMDLAHVGS